MNLNEKLEIAQKILEELDMISTKRIPSSHYIDAEKYARIEVVLNKYLEDTKHRFFNSSHIDVVLCEVLGFDYINIKENDFSLFNLLYHEVQKNEDKNVTIGIHQLYDYYFLNSRGEDFTKNSSFLVPISEFYHSVHLDPDTLNLNGDEPLNFKIHHFDNFSIIVGNGCCNHRLYGIYRALDILNNEKLTVQNLTKIQYESKKDEISNFIRENVLPKLSNNLFRISNFKDNEIVIIINNIEFMWFFKNLIKSELFGQLQLQYFIKHINAFKQFAQKNNITKIQFREQLEESYHFEVTIYSNKNKKIILKLHNGDLKLITETYFDSFTVKSLSYYLNYYFLGWNIGDNGMSLYIYNIKTINEKVFYLNRALKKLL